MTHSTPLAARAVKPRLFTLALACLAVSSTQHALAQDKLLVRHRLPVRLAQEAVNASIAACEKIGMKVSAAVVDRDGGLQVVLRGDEAGIQTVDSATHKAVTSAVFGIDSGVWVDRAARGEPISPLLNQLPRLLLAKGGLVITHQKEVIGGIAVAGAPGGEIDERCARAGLELVVRALPQ